ncbi:FkbM family methyltransferase [Bradyrhizobium sp. S69]|uniref:FkbM family methyltransferase n=1 Tax=Bradyrhizobium sp. S69 TaxID=1641856 RepID=UPI00131B0383|nr:FkbM family methyltransferase [Bradyrhizobium sp. S69]
MLVSYAQNFEDVILWRALKHVAQGFYVDIGAQDPVIDSVSLAFYEKGWRGVHVEPVPAYAAKLRDARMDEDVIEAAIAQSQGPIALFEIPETGLSTGKDEIAQLHAKSGIASKSIKVTALSLSELFARYPNREIHWLKIDVEGMEDEVIASWQPSTSRPWVVVVESTVPRSQQPDYASWEPTLLSLGYEFVYFDGLNRFYVHRDREQLRPAFGSGPNSFDDFTLSGRSKFTRTLAEEIAGLKNEVGRLNHSIVETEKAHTAERSVLVERVSQAERQATLVGSLVERVSQAEQQATLVGSLIERVSRAEQQATLVGSLVERISQAERQVMLVEQLSRDLQLIQSSTSWRLTGPLRSFKRSVRSVAAWPRTITRYGLEHALAWLRCRPRTKALAKSILRFFSPFERRFLAFSRARRTLIVDVDTGWTLEPDRKILSEWRKQLRLPHS